jgi:ribosomal-protein-serine acetyltransferase
MHEMTINKDLRLRTLSENDAHVLFELVDANRKHLREWLPWLDANTEVDHSRAFIRSVLKQEADNLGPTYGIMFSERIVGIVGYHPIQWNNKSVEIGYWLSCEVTGHGIMTKCCRALVDHAFGVIGLNRVTIPAAFRNSKSRAIPERLGFKKEGVIRDAEWLYDHYVDHVLYTSSTRYWRENGMANNRRKQLLGNLRKVRSLMTSSKGLSIRKGK